VANLSTAAGPDRQLALEKYRTLAETYEHDTERTEPYRRQAIDRLLVREGETVIDVGCGTGVNFPLLESYAGRAGQIYGVELSPEMLAAARQRVEARRWKNVSLIEAAVEEAQIPRPADAALFSFTHDILRSPAAVENIIDHVRPGGRIVATGAKGSPLSFYVRRLSRRYVTTLEGFRRPWSHLEDLLGELEVETLRFGAIYVVFGRRPEDA